MAQFDWLGPVLTGCDWSGLVIASLHSPCNMCENPFCLGLCSEWDCCAMEPANKKAKLDSRFHSPQKRETMEEICKGFVPANTKKATGWVIGVFNSWQAE